MEWFDCVASRSGPLDQEATEVAFTVVDQITVCVAYEIDGERKSLFSVTSKRNRAKPIIKTYTG
jgi:adenylosuccinate synthase